MKITLELPPDIEAQLRERLSRRDVKAVRRLLAEALTPTVEALLREKSEELMEEEFEAASDRLADELTASTGPKTPLLSDEAVSREGIYADHP